MNNWEIRQLIIWEEAHGVGTKLAFHYFGIPINVIAEPREWYIYHRQPGIIEVSEDGTKILVEFTAMSISWGTFGGRCLYAIVDNNWNVFRIKPNQSKDISTAIIWLKKRKWVDW